MGMNPLKGEILVKLADKDYKCRLTIDSIIRIEDELDEGILQVAQKISIADVRIKTLQIILKYALRGGGNDLQNNDINRIIANTGIVPIAAEVTKMLVAVLQDDSNESNTTSDEVNTQKKNQWSLIGATLPKFA